MFKQVVQPSLISLFSSTSSDPFALFSTHFDSDLPQDSGLILVYDHDDQPVSIAANQYPHLRDLTNFQLRIDRDPQSLPTGCIQDAVLHMQSPTIKTTFLQSCGELGITLGFLHFQFQTLGPRPFLIEVGVSDVRGQFGRLRVSNFQVQPTLYPASQDVDVSLSRKGPLLHLPLSLPADNVASLTPWRTFTLNLQKLCPHLSNPNLISLNRQKDTESHPKHLHKFYDFQTITYLKIHANMRLRRVWSTATPDSRQHSDGDGQAALEELELVACG